jgi:hypothetical protein
MGFTLKVILGGDDWLFDGFDISGESLSERVKMFDDVVVSFEDIEWVWRRLWLS